MNGVNFEGMAKEGAYKAALFGAGSILAYVPEMVAHKAFIAAPIALSVGVLAVIQGIVSTCIEKLVNTFSDLGKNYGVWVRVAAMIAATALVVFTAPHLLGALGLGAVSMEVILGAGLLQILGSELIAAYNRSGRSEEEARLEELEKKEAEKPSLEKDFAFCWNKVCEYVSGADQKIFSVLAPYKEKVEAKIGRKFSHPEWKATVSGTALTTLAITYFVAPAVVTTAGYLGAIGGLYKVAKFCWEQGTKPPAAPNSEKKPVEQSLPHQGAKTPEARPEVNWIPPSKRG